MSNQLPGQANFEASQDAYIHAITGGGERQLTVHETESLKRKSSLVLTWDVLAETDPVALQGEPRPNFEELNAEHHAPAPNVAPGVVALENVIERSTQRTQQDYDLAG